MRYTSLVGGESDEALSVGRELSEEAGRLLEVDERVVGVDVGVEPPRRVQKVPLVPRPVDLAVEEAGHDVLRVEPPRTEALPDEAANLGRHVFPPLPLRLVQPDAICRLLLCLRHLERSLRIRLHATRNCERT